MSACTARLRASCASNAYERRRRARSGSSPQAAASGGDLPLGALGSGSDFTPFLQHLGIATLTSSTAAKATTAASIIPATTPSITTFASATPASPTASPSADRGQLVLRVADADMLPLQFGDLAETFDGYVKELHKLADDKREHAQTLGVLLRRRTAFELATDPTRPVGPPAASDVPYLDFAAARQCDRAPEAQRQCLRSGLSSMPRRRGRRSRPRNVPSSIGCCRVLSKRLTSDDGSARPALVPASDLCARNTDRLRRQDDAGRARGNRSATLGRGRPIHCDHGARAGGLLSAARYGHRAATCVGATLKPTKCA